MGKYTGCLCQGCEVNHEDSPEQNRPAPNRSNEQRGRYGMKVDAETSRYHAMLGDE